MIRMVNKVSERRRRKVSKQKVNEKVSEKRQTTRTKKYKQVKVK